MEIDIISYTEEQFALLSEEQLLEIKEAQLKKNKLEKQLEEDIQKEKVRLINNGIFHSQVWDLAEMKLQEAYNAEVALLRDALLFYLHYCVKPNGTETAAPYPLDYSLSDIERFEVVRDYYLDAYTNGQERFDAFKQDAIAKQYLGELYKPLYDYLYEFI